jgi:hypothetical protein
MKVEQNDNKKNNNNDLNNRLKDVNIFKLFLKN